MRNSPRFHLFQDVRPVDFNRAKTDPKPAGDDRNVAGGRGRKRRAEMDASSTLNGASMGWPWALPFIGRLLSIATGPLLFAKIWHRHYGKIAAAWAMLTITPIALAYGVPAALAAVIHAILAEYLSFIVLLFALYTVAGGILVTGKLGGTPLTNTAVFTLGTLMASAVGTTGAAKILIRPLIRANTERTHNAHVVSFFIILVANVGGALTPLGAHPRCRRDQLAYKPKAFAPYL
jgi:hypothetical protein